jgi:hypothetical protein
MTPAQLQQEMIDASRKAYSPRRLLHALIHSKGVFKVLAIGETVWHAHLRREWRRYLPVLKAYEAQDDKGYGHLSSPTRSLVTRSFLLGIDLEQFASNC